MYHIVFRTKQSKQTINEANEKELYAYILGIIKNKKSVLYRIGGMPDHIHLLVDIHPTIAVSDFMRELKEHSSKWLSQNPKFPYFEGWGESHARFSYNLKEKEIIIEYIKNQKNIIKNKHLKKNIISS
jgi:REP element-mobilizing transposase RayT